MKQFVFSTREKMIDFIRNNVYYVSCSTYYDPSAGWIVNCNERQRCDENYFESSGSGAAVRTG